MSEHLFFYLGLCLLLAHEMDAVRCHEWRIFPGLSLLPEKAGYYVFVALHIPLYLGIYWGLRANLEGWMHGLDIFFMVHVGLHLLFLLHRNNQFINPFSWALILGTGVAGALDLWS